MNIALINTRPRERAKTITTQVDEYFLPLLELMACPLDEHLSTQLQQLIFSDVVIVVSPMAVQVLIDYIHQLDLDILQYQHIQWLAVGQTTAECLAQYGIIAQTPELETSEGLFQLPIFQQDVKRVTFLRGYGGREWLMQQLSTQGMQVDNILLYRRALPKLSTNIWLQIEPKLVHYQRIFVLISSGASWQNWLDITQSSTLQDLNLCYLVLGERVYQQVSEYCQTNGVSDHQVMYLENLSTSHLMACMQNIEEQLK
ncbi:uroporphyrinogen-III synthase [Moraxella sp. ZY210820]|uniref:uroporphyrinogen-III synthase n=1 Tax=unclassified Moraxella TaxID=2685852 RepID=UPI00273154F9|nr:uroporphyrinogen-III synthase [Moraxella sp. ZY210820]WLF83649.1 uroporphyrinogen-III synthase [Moraxella sp. ZY210820]